MRYAVLEHRLINDVHWDLLLQQPFKQLAAWRLACCPLNSGWQTAQLLRPHRNVYLIYEGPVVPMRGSVVRWDEGSFRLACDDVNEKRVLLSGRRLTGLIELYRTHEIQGWKCRFRSHPRS